MAAIVCVPLIGSGSSLGENPREIPHSADSVRNDKINVFPLTEKPCPPMGSNGLTPEVVSYGKLPKPSDEGKLVGIR
jgi:hypothetical protein